MAEISSTAVTAICHCCKVFCFAVCSDCAGKPTGDAEYLSFSDGLSRKETLKLGIH